MGKHNPHGVDTRPSFASPLTICALLVCLLVGSASCTSAALERGSSATRRAAVQSVLERFTAALTSNDCSTISSLVSDQGQWYTGALWPTSTPTINHSNIQAICQSFSPANGARLLVSNTTFPLLSATRASGTPSHTGTGDTQVAMTVGASLAFNQAPSTGPASGHLHQHAAGTTGAAGSATGVCNIVFLDTLVAVVNAQGQITELREFYDRQDFARQYQRCHPAAAPHSASRKHSDKKHVGALAPHAAVDGAPYAPVPSWAATAARPASSSVTPAQLCQEWLLAFTSGRCADAQALQGSNFSLTDSGENMGAKALSAFCQSIAQGKLADSYAFITSVSMPSGKDPSAVPTLGFVSHVYSVSVLDPTTQQPCSVFGSEVIRCWTGTGSQGKPVLMHMEADFNWPVYRQTLLHRCHYKDG